MTEEQSITIADLRRAMSEARSTWPVENVETEWGWIEFDGAGRPARMGLNEKASEAIRALSRNIREEYRRGFIPLKFDGVPIWLSGELAHDLMTNGDA